MMKERRSFAVAFKREAAALVLEHGYSLSEACKAVDVGATAMRRWIHQVKEEHQGITPKAAAFTPEQ